MSLKTTFISILILCTFSTYAQNKEFEDFTNLHDSLMHKAYKERNPKNYLLSLNKFNEEYSKLSDNDKDYFKGNRITAFYNLSCTYSLLNDKINAIIYLKKSIEVGYNDFDHIQQDTDLDNIRKEKDFLKLIQAYREINDYLYILKKASQYNPGDNRTILKFTYDSEKSPELLKLKSEFKLDSIAGSGDEISKIFNLLHWVHNSFKYDGSKALPSHEGVTDLMTKCYRSNYTMHCGALATVLNDCYLAIGLKSRRVVCLPKDSTDFDCHSINMVFSKTLDKWLWIDPTNNAYVMNEKGDLLSIAEVRECLIDNKPLILNADANLNRIYSRTKNDYLYYFMAKNLYAFECYVDGGGESQSNLLLPVEYKGVIPRSKVNKPKCTNNPITFWAKPD